MHAPHELTEEIIKQAHSIRGFDPQDRDLGNLLGYYPMLPVSRGRDSSPTRLQTYQVKFRTADELLDVLGKIKRIRPVADLPESIAVVTLHRTITENQWLPVGTIVYNRTASPCLDSGPIRFAPIGYFSSGLEVAELQELAPRVEQRMLGPDNTTERAVFDVDEFVCERHGEEEVLDTLTD